MKITCLCENTLCPSGEEKGLGAEHGLSLFIETNDLKILFDAGQSDLFLRNAEKLGIELNDADICVLSHGHFDHGGGLSAFLKVNDHAPVYMNEHAFEPHYHTREKYIGIDPALRNNERIRFMGDTGKIAEGITLYSCNRLEKIRPLNTGGLHMIVNGEFLPEDFRHEQYLMIEENGKKILISGCSHKGIVNIMSWLDPDILIGGFHFMNLTVQDDRAILEDAANRLLEHNTLYYSCHCTGAEQFAFLKEIMGDKLQYLAGGQIISL